MPMPSLRRFLDRFAPLPMFAATVVFLFCLGVVLHVEEGGAALAAIRVASHQGDFAPAAEDGIGATVTGAALLVMTLLYPLYLIELILHGVSRSPRWRQYVFCCLLPPLRLTARDVATGRLIWLPRRGWRRTGRDLARSVARDFSGPMLVIAVLVLPLLALELFWSETLLRWPALLLTLHLGMAVVWVAFTIEFLVMISIVEKKLQYCRQHWIDLAIICLPLIAWARLLRLGRLLRLQQVLKATRLYRLRGLGMRMYQALLLVGLIRGMVRPRPERQLARLRAEREEKEYELAELNRQIAALEAEMAAAPPVPPTPHVPRWRAAVRPRRAPQAEK